MASTDKIYKIVEEFTKSLADSGFSINPPEKIDPIKEIPGINKRLNLFNNVLIGIVAVLGVAFIGFVIDAVYFHITNNKYFENVYELNNNCRQNIDKVSTELQFLKDKHPELFK